MRFRSIFFDVIQTVPLFLILIKTNASRQTRLLFNIPFKVASDANWIENAPIVVCASEKDIHRSLLENLNINICNDRPDKNSLAVDDHLSNAVHNWREWSRWKMRTNLTSNTVIHSSERLCSWSYPLFNCLFL